MIISYRQIFASQDFNDKLKALRRRRFFIEENIKTSKDRLKMAKNEDEYRAIEDHIKVLEMDAADITDEVDRLESNTYWRQAQLEDIKKYGFSMSQHAVEQYNSRFKPYLIREQLMEFLRKLGLGEKLNGNTHQLIELKPNFKVAVERGVVTTFKYNDDYYQGPNTPKFDLGAL